MRETYRIIAKFFYHPKISLTLIGKKHEFPRNGVPEAIDTMVSKALPPPAPKGGWERRLNGRLKVMGSYVKVGNIRLSLVDIWH